MQCVRSSGRRGLHTSSCMWAGSPGSCTLRDLVGRLGAHLPFAFPVLLLAIAALAERAEPVSQSVIEEASTSILGRGVVFRRYPMRWTTVVALTLFNPFYTWVYPRNVGDRLHVTFEIWWLAFTAFTFFLLPRLLRTTQRL